MDHFFNLDSLVQEMDGCIASGCFGHCDGGCKGKVGLSKFKIKENRL